MKNDKKTKSEDKPVYSLSIELQAGHTANFTYSSFELAEAHYVQLQATQFIGSLGVKSIRRSWRE